MLRCRKELQAVVYGSLETPYAPKLADLSESTACPERPGMASTQIGVPPKSTRPILVRAVAGL